MCGRFLLTASAHRLAGHFGVEELRTVPPRYNLAPGQLAAGLALDSNGVRRLGVLKWGFVPHWAPDPKKAPINARAETAADKPFFADSLRHRRCLMPADGFYQWQRQGRRKRPFCIRLWDDRPFAFAGLWDVWQGQAGGPLATFCILTTEANELVRPVHARMPVIVPERYYDLWLSREVREPGELAPALRPYPADAMQAFLVGPAVNDPKKDGPECLQPAA